MLPDKGKGYIEVFKIFFLGRPLKRLNYTKFSKLLHRFTRQTFPQSIISRTQAAVYNYDL